MPKIITLSQAREKGLTHYFTGTPCIKGHVSERFTLSRRCKQCNYEKQSAKRGTKEIEEIQYPDIPDSFGFWLAGLVDGEGCFSIYKTPTGAFRLKFCVGLRNDDLEVLKTCKEITGLGNIYSHLGKQKHKVCTWAVTNKADVRRVVELFNTYELKSKKSRDFKIWSVAALLWCDGNKSSPRKILTKKENALLFETLGNLHLKLKEVRKYK